MLLMYNTPLVYSCVILMPYITYSGVSEHMSSVIQIDIVMTIKQSDWTASSFSVEHVQP